MADKERIALFIDGVNLYATSKELGFDIDYKRLLDHFTRGERLIRAYYYTTILDDSNRSIQPLIDFLDFNGYTVVSKPAKCRIDPEGHSRVKGNMHVELAVNALKMAEHIDRMVLFSGDGDFRALVEAMQEKGVSVSVVSTMKPRMIAEELRRQADAFVEIGTFIDEISRDPDARVEHDEERQSASREGRGRRTALPRNRVAA